MILLFKHLNFRISLSYLHNTCKENLLVAKLICFLNLFTLCLSGWGSHMHWHAYGKNLWKFFHYVSCWVQTQLKLRSSDLSAIAFTCWAISLAYLNLNVSFLTQNSLLWKYNTVILCIVQSGIILNFSRKIF